MPPLYIFEDSQVDALSPLTYSRAAFELRAGACTLLERIQRHISRRVDGLFVRSPLAEIIRKRYGGIIPVNPALSSKEGVLLANGRWLALSQPGKKWEMPPENTAGLRQGSIVWIHLDAELAREIDWSKLQQPSTLEAILPQVRRITADAVMINRPWDLFDCQRPAIVEDFHALGQANHATLLPGVHLLAPENIHLAAKVKIWPGAVLDAANGPIIVEEATEIRPNAVITGPVAIGPHCVIRTAADIREDSTFGPGCKIGGEIIGSIFLGHANKQHHGFLGQSIVGEWANLGAGTTTSNLKNTYGAVNMRINNAEEATGRQFLGSIIADHAKLGIGVYLSTGSVVGFASHITISRPPRFVPSFAWLTDKGLARADFEKMEQIARLVMKRRGVEFTAADHDLFIKIAGEWSQGENFPWPNP